MIYLLSQILLCLALAALLGGAVGWLLQRSRSAARLDDALDAIELRDRQLERARTDVTMLTDDFDDLRERSRVEIDALREDNRRLPALAENLEKSQLLVRQMMQRHDARTRELTAANATLEERLAQLQERAVAQERALVAANAAAASAGTAAGSGGASPSAATGRPDGNPLALSASDGTGESNDAAVTGARPNPAAGGGAGRAALPAGGAGAAEGADELMDEVMEVDEDLAAELLDDTFTGADHEVANGDDDAGGDDDELEDTATVTSRAASGGTAPMEEDEDEDGDEEEDANATLAIEVFAMEDLHDATGALDASGAPEASDSPETDRETAHPARPLFRPVDRQDDLKRIFGITSVTERALNELGITSYPQLAELERPEIEKIARALEIVPEAIERDDWVGNARRQLEDVLEEL